MHAPTALVLLARLCGTVRGIGEVPEDEERLTDFWGVRAGQQATGLLAVDRFRYVIEVGGGSF